MQVGIVITGDPIAPLSGTWASKTAVENGTYQFEISGGSRVSYEFAATPAGSDGTPAQGCRIRVSGALDRVVQPSAALDRYFEAHQFRTPDYVVRYSINDAKVLTSSASAPCAEIADTLVRTASHAKMPRSLFLTKGADGDLIESMAGTTFGRSSRN